MPVVKRTISEKLAKYLKLFPIVVIVGPPYPYLYRALTLLYYGLSAKKMPANSSNHSTDFMCTEEYII